MSNLRTFGTSDFWHTYSAFFRSHAFNDEMEKSGLIIADLPAFRSCVTRRENSHTGVTEAS